MQLRDLKINNLALITSKFILADLTQEKIVVKALHDITVKEMYQKCLAERNEQQPINESDNIDVR